MSKLEYRFLDEDGALLDAQLEYKSNENLWDQSGLSIAEDDGHGIHSEVAKSSHNFLPILKLKTEERLLELRRQTAHKSGQQLEQQLIVELILELILELIQGDPFQRSLELIQEVGWDFEKHELEKTLGRLGQALGRTLILDLESHLKQELKKELIWQLGEVLEKKLGQELENVEKILIQELIQALIERDQESEHELDRNLPWNLWPRGLEQLERLYSKREELGQELEDIREQIPQMISDLGSELTLIYKLMKYRKLEQILYLTPSDIPQSYNDLLRSIAYLGPLRCYPERLYSLEGGGRDSVGIQGEFTPHILFYNTKAAQKMNKWFDSFEIPYELQISEFGSVELVGKYVSITLNDKRTDTPVTLADVGFGINQVLPVIIEGVASPQNTIICVEQPEIHLHPRLQAELAEMMIKTSKDGKQWIVETHSELLILRIQRRIREGKLESSDVSVLYVDPDDQGGKGSTIETLRLDKGGDFIDEWPRGFFDEGFNELMAK